MLRIHNPKREEKAFRTHIGFDFSPKIKNPNSRFIGEAKIYREANRIALEISVPKKIKQRPE